MSAKAQARALITGVGGQDGSYLAELLIGKGYRVYGLELDAEADFPNLDAIRNDPRRSASFQLIAGDLCDSTSLERALEHSRPDEVYNLAARSFVGDSWKAAVQTSEVSGLGVTRLLEALRSLSPEARFFQASSALMYGAVQSSPQTEDTPFRPQNTYATSKLYAHWQTIGYRQAYGLFAATGILFNHESPRRGPEFVTRKITLAAARIKLGLQETLRLGALDTQRDWGYAADYVEGMWRILQHEQADDFVLATGRLHRVRDVCQLAFAAFGLDWEEHVEIDEAFLRPNETSALVGDASKAQELLGWRPTVDFETMIERMAASDLELARNARSEAQR